jgi:large subunit ribosomal protein L22
MQFVAKARYVRYSPYKLRPLADVIRGKNAQYALYWLSTCRMKKAEPVSKTLASAAANAKDLQNIEIDKLFVKDIRVDQGPSYRYYKPGAMGRANPYRKRFSHINIVLESVDMKEV